MEEEQKPAGRIVQREIEDEMRQSYLDYSMSVIVGRALPDVRDGLKPVHRRILYAMYDMGMLHNKPYKKCARIVGEVLGKYHPHGDMAVYDALVRMVQDFSLRYPLVQGQGNFGSIDGDNAAAMRYTESRLHEIAEEMLTDIEKDTVKFIPNFDDTLKEPAVLPSKLPQMLINGSSGIAVGMATNIPPHNIKEIGSAIIALIDNNSITPAELVEFVSGPDFPTGGIICGTAGIKEAYETGKGKLVVRARTAIEKEKNEERIVVSEIPYMLNKSMLLEQIADLIKSKVINGISDLRDESDREGMRIVMELKAGANSDVVLNQLFNHTRLQSTFGVIMIALVDNEPRTLNLKELITYFIAHRQDVVRRRTQCDLGKAEERAHVLEGLVVALDNLDAVIQKIRQSRDVAIAASLLMKDYHLSEIQAKAILDMRLQRLASLEQQKIREEQRNVLATIKGLRDILADEQRILNIIKDETRELMTKYGDGRKTEIIEATEPEFEVEDLVKPEEVIVTMTHSGYVKRLPISTYRQQRRGGRGIIAAGTKEDDFVEDLFVANTHDYILFFTNQGKVHWLKVYSVPEASRMARGNAVANLLNLSSGEVVTAHIPVKDFREGYLFMATKKGIVKRITLEAFANPRRGGIIALTLDEKDELIGVRKTNGNNQIILATKNGKAVRFKEKDVREIGRTGRGVRGIRLKDNDELVSIVVADDSLSLLTITEHGFGKRTSISEYRLIGRGGFGVINIQSSERNGKVVSVLSVSLEDELMVISQQGIAIRMPVKDLSQIGRNTQGVILMRLDKDDRVVAAAKIAKENNKV
jgi:DNA gyrase subunit A